MKKYCVIGLGVLLIAVLAYVALTALGPVTTDTDSTATTTPQEDTSTTTEPVESPSGTIRVSSPQPGQTVGIPLELSGEARGYWFFEATAPVVVTNWDGLIIGEGYITADDDWMTQEYVPFSGSINYSLPADSYSATGTIIFQKANPSDLPENDDAFEIRVQLTSDGTTTTPPVVQDTPDQSTFIACTDEQKMAEICTQEYAPVCGLQEVQCVTTPCDPIPQTYSNICTACATAGVISYAAGECAA